MCAGGDEPRPYLMNCGGLVGAGFMPARAEFPKKDRSIWVLISDIRRYRLRVVFGS